MEPEIITVIPHTQRLRGSELSYSSIQSYNLSFIHTASPSPIPLSSNFPISLFSIFVYINPISHTPISQIFHGDATTIHHHLFSFQSQTVPPAGAHVFFCAFPFSTPETWLFSRILRPQDPIAFEPIRLFVELQKT
jgi:hypothetical protein